MDSPTEKPAVMQAEDTATLSSKPAATGEGISLDSFAHLDQKKILRKV